MAAIDQVTRLIPPERRVMALSIFIVVVVTLIGLFRLVGAPSMSLLYAGLDAGVAGEVVTALEARGIAYEVSGDAILVPSTQRDSLRLALASEGLPQSSGGGYELLDGLTGFGTTSQMYNATYWRAKEGELARTILATRGVQMARVHIATSGSQPFQAPVDLTASVTVSTGGTGLASAQAEAIRFMVASAVGNLLPSNVSVIDSDLGLLLAAGQDSVGITGQRLDARADALRSNVERLLSARVGPGNAIVEVMVDANRVSERVQARQLDPDGAVRISSDSETLSGSASGNSGNVTVASNLPDGDAGGAGGNSSSEAQSRELVNFDVSETVTERVINPGAIERLSVAVMINEADGSPRAEEEIAVLTGLVKSAVGFDAERGDVVTLESLPFERLDGLGSTASGGLFGGGMFDLMPILQMLILSAVLLAIGLFVIRPIVTGTGGTAPALGVEEGMGELGPDGSPALLGDAMRAGGQDVVDAASLSDPVEELQGQIAERSDDALRLLQHWIEKDDYVENKT